MDHLNRLHSNGKTGKGRPCIKPLWWEVVHRENESGAGEKGKNIRKPEDAIMN